jgi:hypothetical protein
VARRINLAKPAMPLGWEPVAFSPSGKPSSYFNANVGYHITQYPCGKWVIVYRGVTLTSGRGLERKFLIPEYAAAAVNKLGKS